MRQTPDLDGRLVPELKVYTRQAETDDGERRGAHELVGRHLSDHLFFFSSRRRHTRCLSDWSSDVCSSDLESATENRPPGRWWALTPPFHPYRKGGRASRPGGLFSVALSFPSPGLGVTQRNALWSSDFPLPGRSEERRVGKEV